MGLAGRGIGGREVGVQEGSRAAAGDVVVCAEAHSESSILTCITE